MGFRRIGPAAYAAAGLAAAALLLTACGGSSSGGGSASGGASTPAASGGAVGPAPSGGPGATTDDFNTMCASLKSFGDIKGKTVKVYTGIVAPEDALYQKAFDAYTQCTGAKVQYEGDKSFEAQVLVRVKAGNPPDIAIVPQPGLLKQLVATGKAVEAPKATADNVDKYFGASWKDLGSVDGKFYAGPNSANVKSLVWYSPKTFKDNGWAIPTTLDGLKTLSDTDRGQRQDEAVVRGYRLRRRHRLAGHGLDGRHDAPALRSRTPMTSGSTTPSRSTAQSRLPH